MKRFVTIALVMAVGACCGDDVYEVDRVEAHPVVEFPDVPECTADDVVKTILPANSAGDVEVMCTSCDAGKCIQYGDACESYGSSCDADGLQGVCVACCNGTAGELHCKPVD